MHITKAQIKLYKNNGEVKVQKFPRVKTLPCPMCGVGLAHGRTGKPTGGRYTYIPLNGDHVTNTCPSLKSTKIEERKEDAS